MYNICVFAGTTEGRQLVEFLCRQQTKVTACVATEYGETLIQPAENLTISAKRLPVEDIRAMLREQRFDLVVDATHPYAASITESIHTACKAEGTEYLRLLRSGSDAPDTAVFVEDIAQAVDYLNTTEGPILLTTGSKELMKYTALRNFQDRVYARVLPMDASLECCRQAGLQPAHIIAMQGPFSQELNTAMLKAVSARFLVTKDGGTPGGFDQKAAAAAEAGAKLVVIGRPPQREGLTYAETLERLRQDFGFTWQPEIAVVGIGPGSRGAMTEEVRQAIEQADCLIGASRMLEAYSVPGQLLCSAIAPGDIAEAIYSHGQCRRFTVVMSGDVGFFSGTKKLLPLLENCTVRVLPGLSSMVTLCARLGTSYEDVVPVSMHGRDRDIVPDVERNRRIFVLVGGENGMGKLCRHLTDCGLGSVQVSVGERLSYPDETITVGTAKSLGEHCFRPLSVALIENPDADPVVTHGLPDEVFQRSENKEKLVPMTKSEVRSVCLSKLRLTEHAVCWDVGAGTGSVSIEMALQARKGRVFAIEKKDTALDLLQENKNKLSVSNMEIVSGLAPEACADLPAPTHVFIGGSSGNLREILELVLAKNPAARIVVTAIALETVGEITACMKDFGFEDAEVVSLTVARDRKAGPYHLMTGQNPIFIATLQHREERV